MNLQKLVTSVLFGLFVFAFTGCPVMEPSGDSTIIIINNSNNILWYLIATDSVISSDPLGNYTLLIISPRYHKEIPDNWKDGFKRYPFRYLYLFDKSIIDTVPWDTIRKNNMYLKRIYFTQHILDSLNWTLTYP